jgi:hypothetical protein
MQKPHVALGQVSVPLLGYLSVNITPATLHVHLPTYHRRCKSEKYAPWLDVCLQTFRYGVVHSSPTVE